MKASYIFRNLHQKEFKNPPRKKIVFSWSKWHRNDSQDAVLSDDEASSPHEHIDMFSLIVCSSGASRLRRRWCWVQSDAFRKILAALFALEKKPKNFNEQYQPNRFSHPHTNERRVVNFSLDRSHEHKRRLRNFQPTLAWYHAQRMQRRFHRHMCVGVGRCCQMNRRLLSVEWEGKRIG